MTNLKRRAFIAFIKFAGHRRTAVAITFMAVVVGNVSLGQELDSSALQKEAAAAAAQNQAKDASAPQTSVGQSQLLQNQPAQNQAAPAQNQPQTNQPQAAQPQAVQPQAVQSQAVQSQAVQPANPAFMLPPGTKLPLGLLRPLTVKPGRDVYLQITFPVTVGSQMLIPPGTYIQGVVEKVIRRERRHDILEFTIHSANLIFLNGYTVPISGTVKVATSNAASLSPQPANGQAAPAMAAVGGPPTLPPLPNPGFGNGPRNAMIAIGVVGAVVTTTALVLAFHGDVQVEVGTPLEIVLPAPVFLDADRVMNAVRQYDQQSGLAPVQIVQPPKKPAMCYDPGSPGTPDIVIPGNMGTPDTVIPGVNGMPDTVIPGTPATPDRTIPGTPGTPSSTYPCGK